MMLNKLEKAVLIGLCVSLLISVSVCTASDTLSSKLVRLHVIANSDSAEDQTLKLAVRDAILPLAQSCSLSELEAAAQETVYSFGKVYPVRVTRCEEYYPVREYDGFSLPSGVYDSVKVSLGDSAGKNWWCVVSPPLCTASCEGRLPYAAKAAGLTGSEIKTITRDGAVYEIRFFAIDLFRKIQRLFTTFA